MAELHTRFDDDDCQEFEDPAQSDSPSEYEIGYCKPPKKHQFKKGRSGNPSGRRSAKKKHAIDAESFPELVAKKMLDVIEVNHKGKREMRAFLQIYADRIVAAAVSAKTPRDLRTVASLLEKIGVGDELLKMMDKAEYNTGPWTAELDARLKMIEEDMFGSSGDDQAGSADGDTRARN